eukprot:TRINITY_DN35795_c0_g1_i1.p1 TRINITY_DN35795_c0_g1~~TRINITY_DN35795_c0_g1_i1.p1  ORF type:complete len:242 (-),score=74.07 TRINITY_DN35795_c0_g1_i1:225-950(-)
MIRRPPRSTLSSSSAASDVYKRQTKEKESIDRAKELREAMKLQSERIQKLKDSAMAFIPGSFDATTTTTACPKSVRRSREALNNDSANQPEKPPPSEKRPRKRAHTEKRPEVEIPSVLYVTQEELDSCPAYVKGRVTVKRVNASVDELVDRFRKSKELLTLELSGMSDPQLNKLKKFREMELPELASQTPFVMLPELTTSKYCKQDSTSKSAMAVLRHLGRINERPISGTSRIFTIGANNQ